jgi:(2Fe-2S) ferredoxin
LATFRTHLFICTNQREPGSVRGSCTLDGKGELHQRSKEAIGEAGLKSPVRANKSGCLDQCEHGPVVVYPEAVWYGFVQAEDVAEIKRAHRPRAAGGAAASAGELHQRCILPA